MKNKKLIYGISVIAALIAIMIPINNYIAYSKETKYSQFDICAEEGRNDIILKAISTKYPESQILEAYDRFSMPKGPFWEVKIRMASGEVIAKDFKCYDNYLLEQCSEEFLRNRDYPGGPGYDQSRSDHCYISVAGFQKDVELCKKIIDEHVKNNCFAYIAGLTPERWNPSICENLTDEEAKSGCVEFFEAQ